MKRRARRVTIGAAVLGAGLIAVLAVVCWDAVRDHVEAWHFQLTRETKTIEPEPAEPPRDEGQLHFGRALIRLQTLSTHAKRNVICDSNGADVGFWMSPRPSVDEILGVLRKSGCRILEQNFPRRAYVVIRAADPLEHSPPQGLLWDGLDPPVRVQPAR